MNIDALANEIRRIDGSNTLGAGELAEKLSDYLAQQKAPEQDCDVPLIDDITRIVREADDVFKKIGGSSRHWTRDCFLPLLNKSGFIIQRPDNNPHNDEPAKFIPELSSLLNKKPAWEAATPSEVEKSLTEYYLPQLKFSMNSAREFGHKHDSSHHLGMANVYEVAIGCIEESITMAAQRQGGA